MLFLNYLNEVICIRSGRLLVTHQVGCVQGPPMLLENGQRVAIVSWEDLGSHCTFHRSKFDALGNMGRPGISVMFAATENH